MTIDFVNSIFIEFKINKKIVDAVYSVNDFKQNAAYLEKDFEQNDDDLLVDDS